MNLGRVIREKTIKEQEYLPELVMDLFIDDIEFQRRISKINPHDIESHKVYINNKETENTHQQLADEFLAEWLKDNNTEMVIERKHKESNKNYTWTYTIDKQEIDVNTTFTEPELNLKMKVDNEIVYECDMNYRNVMDITRLINNYPTAEIILDDNLTLYCENVRNFAVEIKRDSVIVKVETPFADTHYLFYQNDKRHTPIFNQEFMKVYELQNYKVR
jgi:hypothetical protein